MFMKIVIVHCRQLEAPPSYLKSLVNKIIGNIRIYCNNLILKYVEEDIVLSMNVKLLSFESANESWEPAYIGMDAISIINFYFSISLCRCSLWQCNIKKTSDDK